MHLLSKVEEDLLGEKIKQGAAVQWENEPFSNERIKPQGSREAQERGKNNVMRRNRLIYKITRAY